MRIGQAILGKIAFKDGATPDYPRPYLVVSISEDKIGVLNVSSSVGKEHKLLYETNKEIANFNPPFNKPSFVKLDSLTYITPQEAANCKVLNNGNCLDSAELQEIIKAIS